MGGSVYEVLNVCSKQLTLTTQRVCEGREGCSMFQGLTGKNVHVSPVFPEWMIISGTVNVQQGELVTLLGWSHAGLLQPHLASLASEGWMSVGSSGRVSDESLTWCV